METPDGKPQIKMEQITQRFIDYAIFPVNEPEFPVKDFLSLLKKELIYRLSHFGLRINTLEDDIFWKEIDALRIELFTLAFSKMHMIEPIDLSLEINLDKEPGKTPYQRKNREDIHEKSTIQVNVFVKNKLKDKNRLDIWEIMNEYNLVVNQSRYLSLSRKQQDDLAVSLAVIKEEILAKIEESVNDIQCINRVINQINVNVKEWNSVAIKRLATKLSQRLELANYDWRTLTFYPELQIGLAATIYGLFLEAEKFIQSNIKGERILPVNLYAFSRAFEEPLDYMLNHEDEWLGEKPTYRDDGSDFGIILDYWGKSNKY